MQLIFNLELLILVALSPGTSSSSLPLFQGPPPSSAQYLRSESQEIYHFPFTTFPHSPYEVSLLDSAAKQIPNPTTSHHLHCYHCDPSLWGFFSCRLLEKPLSCLPIYSCFPMICYPLRSQKILFFNVYFHAIPLLEHSYTSSTALKIKHRILTMTAPQMSWFLACLSDNCFVTTLLTVLWSCWPSICFSHVASSLLIFTFLDPSHQSSEGESHSPRGLLFNLDQPLSSLLQHRHFPLISF